LLLQFVRINQDELGNRRACEAKTKRALVEGKCAIIDRCNFDLEQRTPWLKMAQSIGMPVDCLVFSTPVAECIRRCESRKNHETIAPNKARGIVGIVERQFSPPRREQGEAFRSLATIRNGKMSNDKILEYLNK
jgi:predicted kinase